jgi:hypothetical protein
MVNLFCAKVAGLKSQLLYPKPLIVVAVALNRNRQHHITDSRDYGF